MKASELQLCVEEGCEETYPMGAPCCPSCTGSQAIPLSKIVNKKPTAILPVYSADAALLHARASCRAMTPKAWGGGEG